MAVYARRGSHQYLRLCEGAAKGLEGDTRPTNERYLTLASVMLET
jgi:hypothetical protein